MSTLDIIKTGIDALGGDKKKEGASAIGVFDSILKLAGAGKNPEAAKAATEVKESSEKERSSLLGEVGRSVFLREFPRAAAVFDMANGSKKFAEAFHDKGFLEALKTIELQTLTAFLVLVPNDLKHHFTDLFADTTIFRTLVQYWPGLDGVKLPVIGEYLDKDLPVLGKGGPIRQRILDEKDPDAVIEALRIMCQDIKSGKVTFDMLKDKLGGNTAALAALGGGAAALTAGEALLANGSGGSNLIDKGKQALGLGGGLTGKKLLELDKAHPEAQKTKMQTNLLELLRTLNVSESAELIKGKWEDNNDEVTISFIYDNAKYYLIFDDDVSGTDVILNTSDGRQIAKFTDWGGFDAKDSAKDLVKAMRSSPAPELPKPATKAANEITPATRPKKAA